jgi:hypothetical protein
MDSSAVELLQGLEGTADLCTALDKEYKRRSRWHDAFVVLVWIVAIFTAALVVTAIGVLIWLVATFSTTSAIENAVKVGGVAATAVGGYVTGKAMGVLRSLRDDAESDVNDCLDRMRDAQCTSVPTPVAPKLI